MTGNPTVSIELVEGLVTIDCADCLITFMSGWTKSSLENDYSDDRLSCAMAGVERVISFNQKNKSELGKISDIEKLIKLKNKGKLLAYVEGKLK